MTEFQKLSLHQQAFVKKALVFAQAKTSEEALIVVTYVAKKLAEEGLAEIEYMDLSRGSVPMIVRIFPKSVAPIGFNLSDATRVGDELFPFIAALLGVLGRPNKQLTSLQSHRRAQASEEP